MNGTVAAIGSGLLLLVADAAWLATRPEGPRPPAGVGSLEDAQASVRAFVAGAAALRAADGDLRLAERLPAGPDLLRELLADIAFARRQPGPTELHELVRLEVTGAELGRHGAAEVRTREFWVFRRPRASGAAEARPIAVWTVRYELGRAGGAWRVVDYQLERVEAGAGTP